MIQLKADNYRDIVAGKPPTILVPQDEWDNVLKVVKELPILERFDEVTKEKPTVEINEAGEPIVREEIVTINPDRNAFEEVSKKVKESLNGKTQVSAKKN